MSSHLSDFWLRSSGKGFNLYHLFRPGGLFWFTAGMNPRAAASEYYQKYQFSSPKESLTSTLCRGLIVWFLWRESSFVSVVGFCYLFLRLVSLVCYALFLVFPFTT